MRIYQDASGRYVPGHPGGNEGGGEEFITINLPGLAAGAKPLEMVKIEAGTFTMGSPSDERGRYDWEWSPHEVTITQPFYLGCYEVTQAQWEAVMGSNPAHSYGVGDDYPVYYVSWDDCQTFISNLEWPGPRYVSVTDGSGMGVCVSGGERILVFRLGMPWSVAMNVAFAI